MLDGYARTIDYLRISVTDKCNLRCRYCMPGEIHSLPMSEILTFEETVSAASLLAELGIRRIRVTGGEPLIRRDIVKLIAMLKGIPGIEEVDLTTNGVLLKDRTAGLKAAGLDGVNISIDTTDPDMYEAVTGHSGLTGVLEGLDEALSSGLRVKINAVSIDWEKFHERDSLSCYSGLIDLARDKDICVRFIEIMPIGYGKDFPCIPHDKLIPMICGAYEGMERTGTSYGNGPAVYYDIPGFEGHIGFISALNAPFCDTCNRIRLTTTGYLKTCLCYDEGVDLKSVLRSDAPEAEKRLRLKDMMSDAILCKPKRHSFSDSVKITEKHAMSAIGG